MRLHIDLPRWAMERVRASADAAGTTVDRWALDLLMAGTIEGAQPEHLEVLDWRESEAEVMRALCSMGDATVRDLRTATDLSESMVRTALSRMLLGGLVTRERMAIGGDLWEPTEDGMLVLRDAGMI